VCGVLEERTVCAEERLFWWLERELEDKTEQRMSTQTSFSKASRPTWVEVATIKFVPPNPGKVCISVLIPSKPSDKVLVV
jgi:hypothetical protein